MSRVIAAMYLAAAALASGPALADDASDAAAVAPAFAAADVPALEALRDGHMKKLIFAEPTPLPEIGLIDEVDGPVDLAAYQGQYVVLNFWATWCAPCRHEMPTLANLQVAMEDLPVEVVTVATGRNSVQGMVRFFDEIEVDNLPLYRDPRQEFARAMSVLGLPITVIVDPEGREIARLRGDADWDSDSAVAILTALAGGAES